MKNIVAVYPGTFCPPTYGHLEVIKKSVEIFGQIIILCSRNDKKNDNWFSEEECKKMWLSYNLPKNTIVITFNEFISKKYNPESIVMIRGIRSNNDFELENKTMELNNSKFNISKYFYVFSDNNFSNISSSKVREIINNFDFLSLPKFVNSFVINKLFEKKLGINNLFIVAGKPASGKSTFLKRLSELYKENLYINTDDFNKILEVKTKQHFGNDIDYIKMAIEEPKKLSDFLKDDWFDLLKKELLKKNKNINNIFIEIPYALCEDKHSYIFLGNKILYFGCNNNLERLYKRDTPQYREFIDIIPSPREAKNISIKNNLKIKIINTDFDELELDNKIHNFQKELESEVVYEF